MTAKKSPAKEIPAEVKAEVEKVKADAQIPLPLPLNVNELLQIASIIEFAQSKGVFPAEDLSVVGGVYNRIKSIVEAEVRQIKDEADKAE